MHRLGSKTTATRETAAQWNSKISFRTLIVNDMPYIVGTMAMPRFSHRFSELNLFTSAKRRSNYEHKRMRKEAVAECRNHHTSHDSLSFDHILGKWQWSSFIW